MQQKQTRNYHDVALQLPQQVPNENVNRQSHSRNLSSFTKLSTFSKANTSKWILPNLFTWTINQFPLPIRSINSRRLINNLPPWDNMRWSHFAWKSPNRNRTGWCHQTHISGPDISLTPSLKNRKKNGPCSKKKKGKKKEILGSISTHFFPSSSNSQRGSILYFISPSPPLPSPPHIFLLLFPFFPFFSFKDKRNNFYSNIMFQVPVKHFFPHKTTDWKINRRWGN